MNKVSFRLRWLLGGILSLILILLILLVWGVSRQNEDLYPSSPAVHEKIDFTSPIAMKGISYQEITGRGLAYSLRANEFKIHPRAIGVFSIQPWKEATLTDAFMEVHLLTQDNPSEVDLFPSSFSSSFKGGVGKQPLEGIGIITRLVIKNVHFNMYKDRMLIIAVTADEAISNFTEKDAVLKGVQIEHRPSGKFITTKRAVWDAGERIFKIPGEYTATTPKGTAKGYGIKVDLNFKVEKMPS